MINALTLLLALSADPRPVMSALERMPVHVSDRGEEGRRARLSLIASAVERIDDKRIRALVLAKGQHESGYSREVCSGEVLGDGGKAFGCWQMHGADRSGGIAGQVRRAADRLRRAGNYCRAQGYDFVTGAISNYATGKHASEGGCSWAGAKARAVTYRRIFARL